MAYKYTHHLLHCALMIAIIAGFEIHALTLRLAQPVSLDPWTTYGVPATITLYSLRLLLLVTLPNAVFSFLGLALFDAFPGRVAPAASKHLAPRLCFRVVTRGDYPRLVGVTVTRNLATCVAAGLEHFVIEVVSDAAVGVTPHARVKEVVVPQEYRTKSGALFKARALQYCLEDGVNQMSDNDWIVHLDEETLLTEDSVNGIVNFVSEGKHHFGQGLITYANEEIVNWWTTLADVPRVAVDMGCLQFLLRVVHSPLIGWKGSFLVAKVCAERQVTFDHGPDGSVSEDNFFALKADQLGFTFDFIEGEMWEKCTFTLADFMRQRRRWIQGTMLVAQSSQLPLRQRLLFLTGPGCLIVLPLLTAATLLAPLFPVPFPVPLDALSTFTTAVSAYYYVYGVLKSFPARRHGLLKCAATLLAALAASPALLVLSNAASLWALFGNMHRFHVVDKNVPASSVNVGSGVVMFLKERYVDYLRFVKNSKIQ